MSVVEQQIAIHQQDMADRREHEVKVGGALAEALRLVKDLTKKIDGFTSVSNEFNSNLQQRIGSRVDELLHVVHLGHSEECKRRGAWCVLGESTGAPLVDRKTNEVLTLERLVGHDGNVRTDGLISLDPVTGLLFPSEDVRMLGPDGRTPVAIPSDFVLHPRTGRLLPVEGSVAFDPISTRLVFTADSGSAEAGIPPEPLIPYIPYPANPRTGVPVETTLRTLEKRSDMHLNYPMADQTSGQYVPILAVTIHPQGHMLLPVGGVHSDPITGLPVPIEIGGLMLDKQTKEVVPIAGITIDRETGDVVPVGGVAISHLSHHNSVEKPILAGDQIRDPLSGRNVRVTGARIEKKGNVVPTNGGFSLLLDANELACEERVVDSIMKLKAVSMSSTEGGSFNIHAEQAVLDEALTQLGKARTCTKKLILQQGHSLTRRRETAMTLKETGGSPGCMEFVATGQLLPLLIGTTMQDPAGSGLEVPILGVDRDPQTDTLIPLGGTMEDPEGAGLVPIALGKQALDSVTAEQSPVCGVRINPETKTVVPVTLSSRGHKKRNATVGSESLLEDDAAARHSFWRRQKQKGYDVVNEEAILMADLLDPEYHIDLARVNSGLDSITDMTRQIDDSLKRETQRRADIAAEHATRMPPDVVAIMTEYDSEERDLEKTFISYHAKFTGTVRRFTQKLQEENAKYDARLADLREANNPDAQEAVRCQHHEMVQRLRDDLRQQLNSRLSSIDLGYAALGYVRELADLCLQEAKGVLTGSIHLAGEYDTVMSGFFEQGIAADGSNRELVPLLERLIELMETGGTGALTTAIQSGTLPLLQGTGRPTVGAKAVVRRSGVVSKTAVQQVTRGRTTGLEKVESVTAVGGSQPTSSLVIPTLEITETDGGEGNRESQRPSEVSLLHVGYSSTQKAAAKNLTEKHAIELVKLENQLLSNERSKINEVLEEMQKEKLATLEESKETLRESLHRAQSDGEVEDILTSHAQRLQTMAERLEQQKFEKIEVVKEQLCKERLEKKKELRKAHVMEAEAEGLSSEIVVDGSAANAGEVNAEIGKLSLEQEALLEELNKAFAEEASTEGKERQAALAAAKDREMEAAVLAMNSSRSQSALETYKDACTADRHKRDNVTDKLKAKGKMRRRNRRDTVTDETILGDTTITDSGDLTITGDVALVAHTMMEVYSEVQKEKRESELMEALMEIDNVTGGIRKIISEKYEAQAEALERKFAMEKDKQRDVLMARLAARHRLREEQNNEKLINERMKKVQEVQISIGGGESRHTAEVMPELVVTAEAAEEKKKLEGEQIEQQAELELRHRGELTQMSEEIERERRITDEQVSQQMEQQKIKMLKTKEEEFQRMVEERRQREELSKEEYDRFLEAHKQEVAAMEAGLQKEKEKQQKTLHEKLAEKKKKKADRLIEKQKTEVERSMIEAKEERDALVSKMLRAAEMTALSDSVRKQQEEGNAAMAETVIYRVLQQRHMRETVQLAEQNERRMATAIADAKAPVEDERQAERERLVSQHEQAMMDLIAKAGSLKRGELAQKKADMKRQQKMQLRDFDQQTTKMIGQAEKEAQTSAEVDYAHKRLELREQQLQELASVMKELTPEQVRTHVIPFVYTLVVIYLFVGFDEILLRRSGQGCPRGA